MGLIDTALTALEKIPLTEVIRERLAFAADRFAEMEAKVDILQAESAELKAELKIERLNHQKTQEQLQRLHEEHAEEVRIHSTIEFRRGKRTGLAWTAFCPLCHLPAETSEMVGFVGCSSQKCGWSSLIAVKTLPEIVATL